MIWGAMSVYREAELIERGIRSLAGLVDRILVLDGPYIGARQIPDDGTEAIIKDRFANDYVIYQKLIPMRETEKRSLFFTTIPENDWMLILDGDETIEYNPPYGARSVRDFILLHTRNTEVLWVESYAWNPHKRMYENIQPRPRLIRVRKGYRYDRHHRNIIREDGTLLTDTNFNASSCPMAYGMRLVNWYDCRSDPERRSAWLDYGRLMTNLNWDERKLATFPEEPSSASSLAATRPPSQSQAQAGSQGEQRHQKDAC